MFNINKIKTLLSAYHPPDYVVKQQRDQDGVDGRIVSCVDRTSYIAEQYKVLRTNLYSLSAEKSLKTIILTSAQPQEGKSITACNLAVTLSLDTEKKILLADADFRRPSIHDLLGLPKRPGFSDVLNDETDLESFTEKPAIGNLFVLPSGSMKANPSEILSSTKLKNLIEKLKLKFDYVIFDTPPVLNVTDASILGSLCDMVVFVVKAGVTQRNMVQEAFGMLKEAQAKPVAAILTNLHFLLDSYNRYQKFKYYNRYADRQHIDGAV